MLIIDLAIAGIGIGAVAALAGLGLLVTYQLTGVFNLAFGAIAMMSAYLVWWLVRVEHWPVGTAAAVVLIIGCPMLGLLLDRVVFRPLQRRDHSPAETLTATVGVFVLLVGTAFTIWGGQARTDAPSLASGRVLALPGDTVVRYETLVDLAVVLTVALLLALILRTRPGLNLRAAVARRELAQLAGIDTDRISALGWVTGSVLAGISGILLAPSLRLDPYTLTLLVLETMAVAVIARLAHPGIAIAAALAIGIAQSELTQFHLNGRAGALLQSLSTNLFVVVLLGALLVIPRFVGSADDAGSTSRLAVRREFPTPRGWWIPALALLAVPLVLSQESLLTAQQVPALAIILVSIVVLSGYGGQISLGTAGFAGLGALLTADLSRGALSSLPRVGDVLAFPVGALLVVPVGLLTGWPAIRRRGLFLALTTFAVGAMVSRFVFEQPAFVSAVVSGPPELFRTDHNFYVFELVCLGGAVGVGAQSPSGPAGSSTARHARRRGRRPRRRRRRHPAQGLLVRYQRADRRTRRRAVGFVGPRVRLGIFRSSAEPAVVRDRRCVRCRQRHGGRTGRRGTGHARCYGPARHIDTGSRRDCRHARPYPRRSALLDPARNVLLVPDRRHGRRGEPGHPALPRRVVARGTAPTVTAVGESGPATLLEARQLVRGYDGRVVVDHVDISAAAGQITAIIGPNGAGKTTLFNTLAGAERPDRGNVLLDGLDITHLDSDARARLGLARTFQQSTVFGSLTVEENLRVGAENRHHDGTLRGLVGLPDRSSSSATAIVEQALTDVGLRSLRDTPAGSLPTGTLRLVELARALCTQPAALLLDEPASGLDDSETEELHQLLHRLAERGLALLLVEHDLDLVREAADLVYVMAAGRIIVSGPQAEVIGRPDVRAVALGIPT